MSANRPVHLAIDLGASGGRVLAGFVTDNGVQLDVLHRFANGGVYQGERFVWNLLGLWQEIENGLNAAAAKYGSSICSIGVDTWGVDYVLLDRNEDVVGPCFHYRDKRTRDIFNEAFARLSREQIFAETGLQFMEINTAYQLLSMRLEGSPLLDVAEQFLMVPDYFHWQLCGEKCNEYTNASTTQLLNADAADWSRPLLDAFELPAHIFAKPIQPGQILGKLKSSVAQRAQLSSDINVILPATHDTGSAVLAVPANSFAQAQPDWCYISCGTWSLMGVEVSRPIINDSCKLFNFTNEGGVEGSVRLLKNICGLWIVQQCRAQWKREGHDWSWDRLIELAEQAPRMVSIIEPDDISFATPANMPEAIRDYCRRTGQQLPENEGALIRCALESLALKYRLVLDYLEQLVGNQLSTIHMVGGGVQNRMLCQFASDACQRVVVAGPVEATALGNVLMQAIGSGELGNIDDARRLVRSASDIRSYSPNPHGRWPEGFARLRQLTMAAN